MGLCEYTLAQPLTQLYKIHPGAQVAQADQRIAAMRNALPALLDVAEAARKLLDGLAQDEADDGSIRSFVQIGELDNALARLDGTGRGDAEKADS